MALEPAAAQGEGLSSTSIADGWEDGERCKGMNGRQIHTFDNTGFVAW